MDEMQIENAEYVSIEKKLWVRTQKEKNKVSVFFPPVFYRCCIAHFVTSTQTKQILIPYDVLRVILLAD